MNEFIVFDIETGPASEATLNKFLPDIKPPANYKDPAKIDGYVQEKVADFKNSAALSGTTGKVLCVGVKSETGNVLYLGENGAEEGTIIEATFGILDRALNRDIHVVGHNILAFDLPFLFRRAWKLGIPRPHFLQRDLRREPLVQDTMQMWACGNYGERISLNNLALHFGMEPKDHDGGEFARLWTENRTEALAYLKYDLEITETAYLAMR